MTNKQTIFIAGLGMMGSACAEYLRDNHPELEIYAADDFSGSDPEDVPEGINFTKMDLRDRVLVKNYFDTTFKDKPLDYVINYAASAREILSFFTPQEVMSRNIDLFRNVLTNAINHKVKKVVYFSSMSRYGDGILYNGDGDIVIEQQVPYKESMIPTPCDPYASSKVSCELMLKSFQHVYDFDYTVVIPHNCFSPRQRVEPYRNYLAIFMNLILKGKQPVIYGDGMSERAISWVDDFNPTICESIFNPAAKNQTFNIGGDDHRTINEWWDLVKKVTGTSIDAIHMDARPGEVKRAFCDHSKAERLLGFKNKTNIEDALKQMWDYFVAKGPREFKYIDEFEIESDKIPKTWKNKLF